MTNRGSDGDDELSGRWLKKDKEVFPSRIKLVMRESKLVMLSLSKYGERKIQMESDALISCVDT
jgi:hypothetical protein